MNYLNLQFDEINKIGMNIAAANSSLTTQYFPQLKGLLDDISNNVVGPELQASLNTTKSTIDETIVSLNNETEKLETFLSEQMTKYQGVRDNAEEALRKVVAKMAEIAGSQVNVSLTGGNTQTGTQTPGNNTSTGTNNTSTGANNGTTGDEQKPGIFQKIGQEVGGAMGIAAGPGIGGKIIGNQVGRAVGGQVGAGIDNNLGDANEIFSQQHQANWNGFTESIADSYTNTRENSHGVISGVFNAVTDTVQAIPNTISNAEQFIGNEIISVGEWGSNVLFGADSTVSKIIDWIF